MSDTDNKPTLGRKPLGLKRSVEAGEVKQTFSHGRTNKVVVEVKRRKVLGGKPEGGHVEAPAAPAPVAAPAPAPAPVAAPAPAPAPVAPAAPVAAPVAPRPAAPAPRPAPAAAAP
jgi:translation initiation factor IF-2